MKTCQSAWVGPDAPTPTVLCVLSRGHHGDHYADGRKWPAKQRPAVRSDQEVMDEARPIAEQLVTVVDVHTHGKASAWLLDQVHTIRELVEVAMAAASMVPLDDPYKATLAEKYMAPKPPPT